VHTDDVVRFRVRVVAARASEWTAWAAERGFSETLGKNRLFGSLRQAVQAFRDEAQAAPK